MILKENWTSWAKAFHTFPHQRLIISKLHGYEVHDQVLGWIKDFIFIRTQYVSVNSFCTSMILVTYGVQQSSVLVPTLFTYFINCLPECANSMIKKIDDDTKIYSRIFFFKYHRYKEILQG